MSDISLADVARALDDQMTGQARIVAHLVAASESAAQDAGQLIDTLSDVAATTVLDECWITEETGIAYLTNVRDASGEPVYFRFDPDPAVQPQASAFFRLLSSAPDSDDVVAQGAQVREIDNEVFKYVGVSGVDRRRIVQVGNALAFEEQARQGGVYTSPVMTAVLATFSEPDLLAAARTREFGEIRSVFERLLGQQMIVQAVLLERFVAAADAAGWSTAEIDGRLRRIVRSSPIGEIQVATRAAEVICTSRPPDPTGAAGTLRHATELEPVRTGATRVVEHPAEVRETDGACWKYVTVAGGAETRIAQVGLAVSDRSPASPRFGEMLAG